MMRAMDLFAGAGGLTEGARACGATVLWAANHSARAVEWYGVNNPGVARECQDLRQANFRLCPDVDLVVAGPACQGHSPASQGRRSAKHEADRSTAWAVVDALEAKRPRAVVVENVPWMPRWVLFDAWCSALRTLGYTLTAMVLDAADYGVPQERTRLFIVGRLDGRNVEAPPVAPVRRTARDILQPDAQGWARVTTKPTGVVSRVARARARFGSTFLTQHVTNHPGRSLDRPIGTITCASMHWHLVDGAWIRPLSVRELQVAQGFRTDFQLPPQVGHATRLLGNAVPPPLAAAVVAQAIKDLR